jgi:hypothetical protein
LVEVAQQQNIFSKLGVALLDAIGKARLGVGKAAFHAEPRELLIGKSIEGPERRGIETRDAEGHGDLLEVCFSAPCLPLHRASFFPIIALR